ncbi:MAG: LicD family protein [Lachnospiraceae bacterium]|nr:LicD family protein [Lachnospiraceae bacterium]
MVVKRNNEQLSPNEFRRLQLVELSLIKELDRVCRKNGIRYSIFCGTLLGAVRHKGYIPWDDDADIAMLRKDYEKFKKVRNQLNPRICFFQDHDTDPEYLWGYGKLRRVGTCHLREGQTHIKCQNGVYIDIFPLDDVPKSVIGQVLQDITCFCMRKILWSKVGRVSDKGLMKLWYRLISIIPADSVHKALKRFSGLSRYNSNNRVRCLLFPAFGTLYLKTHPLRERYGMPKRWFKELSEYEFEGCKFLGTRDYDGILKYIYEDYMTPPPEEKRVAKVSFHRMEF